MGQGEDTAKVLDRFKSGLYDTLKGAGVAFSTSLFGLGGSLILGFLDLQAAQAQNRFYTDLEDWLSGMTRISALPTDTSGDSFESVSSYLQALLEHTATTMDELSQTIVRGESERAKAAESVGALGERLGLLADLVDLEQLAHSLEPLLFLQDMGCEPRDPPQHEEGLAELWLEPHVRSYGSYGAVDIYRKGLFLCHLCLDCPEHL